MGGHNPVRYFLPLIISSIYKVFENPSFCRLIWHKTAVENLAILFSQTGRIKNSFGTPFQFTKFIFTKGNYIGVKPRVATISRFYKVCTALQSQSILPHCFLKVNIIRGVLGQSPFPRLSLCSCRV